MFRDVVCDRFSREKFMKKYFAAHSFFVNNLLTNYAKFSAVVYEHHNIYGGY
jgi:hypothetical protein